MHEMLGFWHYFFLPVGQAWYTGSVWGNQLQWTIVWLPTLIVIYRKKWECGERGCWRIGHYQVGKTHHKTCTRHTTDKVHKKLLLSHKHKHPTLHKFLKSS